MIHSALTVEALDQIHTGLSSGDRSLAMRDLFGHLQEQRSNSSPEQWERYRETVVSHPLCRLVHEDPMSRRSFEKPRGYAGDAVLLDYIYQLRRPCEASPVGRAVYDFAVGRPAACAVRHRRDWIAHQIDRTAEVTDGDARILSVACGHLREAALSSALRGGWVREFVALDADPESLALVDEQRLPGVETVEMSISRLIAKRRKMGRFDLIYSAGLYDYLDRDLGIKLTRALFEMLAPGGRLLFSNFRPTLRDAGYMESFMGWNLILRTEAELEDLMSGLPANGVVARHVYSDWYGAIVYAEAWRSK